jgi:hypothetical protein
MFTQNINVPSLLEEYHVENEYFILYYHFIRHAFGLKYWNHEKPKRLARFAIYLDDPPQHPDKFDRFKGYMASLSQDYSLNAQGIRISKQDVTGVRSHEHNIMQCLDILLGGMQSRLNECHTKAEPGSRRKSKRARAKTIVYKRIQERLWEIYPHFNVGASTGVVDISDRWSHPYRHWKFVPNNSTMDRSRGKKAR